MKVKYLAIMMIALGFWILSSCDKSKLFVQPTIEVTGISLKELPGDSAHITVDVKIHNQDTREAEISDATYQATIEGFVSGTEKVEINKTITTDTPLVISLPLTMLTKDAVKLLVKMNKGESLDYIVTGTFHVNEKHLDKFDLPINVTGSAKVDIGFDDFFDQPDVVVDSIEGTYTISGTFPSNTYEFNLDAYCTIKNMDDRSAEIDEIAYTPTIEGQVAEDELYSDTYPGTTITMDAGETIHLILPVNLTVNNTQGLALISGLSDGYADYIIDGTFHTIKVNGATNEFKLPLYEKGKVPASHIHAN